MDSISYFHNKLEQEATLAIQRIHKELVEDQASIEKLVTRTGWTIDPVTQFDGELIVITNPGEPLNYHDLQPRADRFLFTKGTTYGQYRMVNGYTFDREATYSGGMTEDGGFYYFESLITDQCLDSSLTYRDREGKITSIEKEDNRFLIHFGREPHLVKRVTKNSHCLVKITNLLTDQQYCYLVYGKKINLIKLNDEFFYLRRNEVIHCASGRVALTLDITDKLLTPICGDGFVYLSEKNDPEYCHIIL
jgi:hypothetical protein